MRFALVALLAFLGLSLEAFAAPPTITLTATGAASAFGGPGHAGTFTLTPVPGYADLYRYTNAVNNPTVCWAVSVSGGKVLAISGAGQFHGNWSAIGDINYSGALTGTVGATVSITNP